MKPKKDKSKKQKKVYQIYYQVCELCDFRKEDSRVEINWTEFDIEYFDGKFPYIECPVCVSMFETYPQLATWVKTVVENLRRDLEDRK